MSEPADLGERFLIDRAEQPAAGESPQQIAQRILKDAADCQRDTDGRLDITWYSYIQLEDVLMLAQSVASSP